MNKNHLEILKNLRKEKLRPGSRHALQVSKLSLKIYDELVRLKMLADNPEDRVILKPPLSCTTSAIHKNRTTKPVLIFYPLKYQSSQPRIPFPMPLFRLCWFPYSGTMSELISNAVRLKSPTAPMPNKSQPHSGS